MKPGEPTVQAVSHPETAPMVLAEATREGASPSHPSPGAKLGVGGGVDLMPVSS